MAKCSWRTREDRDIALKGIKPYEKRSERLTAESRQEAITALAEKITEDRDIKYFADIFNAKPMSNKLMATIMGLNKATITTQKWKAGRDNKPLGIKTTFCYRALKHLKPEIIYFLLNDTFFDDDFELKREFREALEGIDEVNEATRE